jgi:hypothetical protein
MIRNNRTLSIFIVLLLILSGCRQPSPRSASTGALTTVPGAATEALLPTSDIPYELISAERMLTHLEYLTNIQAYSGFRTAGTTGEVESFDYIAAKLERLDGLKAMGLQIERQSFEVYVSTEIHSAELFLTGADGVEVEVPVSALRGSRYNLENSLYFDTDGRFEDLQNDPMTSGGLAALDGNAGKQYAALFIQTTLQLKKLSAEDVQDRILFADASLFDAVNTAAYETNRTELNNAIDQGAAGVVLVSKYSNNNGENHGSFVNEGYYFQNMPPTRRIPILAVRLEDLAPAGITGWDSLEAVASARMLVDSDVLSPAPSGNLVVRIPGLNPDKAMIVSAHIDSPNTPGGFDDGSGTVILLELAEVLNESGLQPTTDLWLVWHGSHENGLYGSAWFAATHAELLDRTLAVLNVDCLGLPLEETNADIILDYSSHGMFGDDSAPWQEFLQAEAARLGIDTVLNDEPGMIADNSNFDTYGIPEIDLIYFDPQDLEQYGNTFIHYSNHWHDSYETVDLVRSVSDVLVNMAKVALMGAIETGRESATWRDLSQDKPRALFVASHTAPPSMVTSLRELGMALSTVGFDVDALPYGTPVTAVELENANIVVLLPTYDYPSAADESWSEAELAALTQYINNGGLLVVTNSEIAHIMTVPAHDFNEDILDINDLLIPLGITFNESDENPERAKLAISHALTKDAVTLLTYGDAGVTFSLEEGEVLYTSNSRPMVALVDVGGKGGQVLVIGDLAILIDNGRGEGNLQFLINIAKYAMDR